jgi:hypothetical protein
VARGTTGAPRNTPGQDPGVRTSGQDTGIAQHGQTRGQEEQRHKTGDLGDRVPSEARREPGHAA